MVDSLSNPHDKPHVHVSLTSISQRIGILAPTIRSLLSQSYPSFSVTLYLSSEPYLLDQGVSGELPDDLKALADGDSRFRAAFTRNIGPYRKILPILIEGWGARRLIATADDDTIYPEDWLARLVENYEKHKCVICYRGHMIAFIDGKFAPYRHWMVNKMKVNPHLHIVPTGKDGILYDTDFFHPRVLDYGAAYSLVPTTDDLWLKWHTAVMGVKCYSINTDYTTQTFENVDLSQSLYLSFNKGGKNDEAIQRLEAYARSELNFSLESA